MCVGQKLNFNRPRHRKSGIADREKSKWRSGVPLSDHWIAKRACGTRVSREHRLFQQLTGRIMSVIRFARYDPEAPRRRRRWSPRCFAPNRTKAGTLRAFLLGDL